MELTSRKRSLKGPLRKTVITDSGEPCHDLLIYTSPPTCTIPLSDLYKQAVDRIKVLKIMEQTFLRSSSKNIEEKKLAFLHELKKNGLKSYAKLLTSNGCTEPTQTDLNARSEDHVSHFIVRLAHCHSASLRHWFLSKELELFRLRFSSLSTEGIRRFLAAYNLKFIPITSEEKSLLITYLSTSTFNVSHALAESMDFYKVPFTDVLDLVRNRKLFIRDGYAYLPSRDLCSILSTIFRRNLLLGLALSASCMSSLEEDERLKTLINLYKIDMSQTFDRSDPIHEIMPEDLDHLSEVSFPPCMRQCHESIRINHHAKHGTRMQYGLFLKSIGLSLDNSIKFWMEAFTKNMSVDKFEKQYLYNIRHNYGQEGKRTSYSAYSCMKILSGSVGAGDCHGCPFKHNSHNILKKQLENFGIEVVDIPLIMDFVSKHQYELACTKYFELKHPKSPVDVIYHPKQYFDLSRKYHVGDKEPVAKKNVEANYPVKKDEATSSDLSKAQVDEEKEVTDDWDPWGDASQMEIDSLLVEEVDAIHP